MPLEKVTLIWPKSIPKTQFSQEFLQGMLNRVAVGYHNYGSAKENASTMNWLQSLKHRIAFYRKTHNTENMIDVANYAMLEFMYSNDSKSFFKATDKSGSPGAKTKSGRIVKGKEDIY